MTTREQFDAMVAWLGENALKFRGMEARYQVELSGEDGGSFWLAVDRGRFSWGEGTVERPTATVSCRASDFKLLASGQMSPASAFILGKVRLKGDIAAAMQFGTLLA